MPKPTKKTSTLAKPADAFKKSAVVASKKTSDKTKGKKKVASSSDESSSDDSSDESSSDDEPKKSKKATGKKATEKKGKKKVVSSSEDESSSDESSSEDEAPKKTKKTIVKVKSDDDDDEIVVEKPLEGLATLGKGLSDVAQQLAASNANQGKILEMLANIFAKLELREHKDDVNNDLLEAIESVVSAGKLVTIGNSSSNDVRHFDSVDNLKANMGNLATKSNFEKIPSVHGDEDEEDEATDNVVKSLADPAEIVA